MFTSFKERQKFERLIELYEKVDHLVALTQEELIEMNMIFNILKAHNEYINIVHQNITEYHNTRDRREVIS